MSSHGDMMMAFSRRTLLKTLPAGSVAPYLAPLVARAESEAAGVKPMRFVFVVEGNGFVVSQVLPKGFKRHDMQNPQGNAPSNKMINGEDDLVDLPLGTPDTKLCHALQPLERHLDRVTLLTGLSGRIAGGGHGNGFGALGAYPAIAGPKDVTIDCALAKARPGIRNLVSLGFWQDPANAATVVPSGLSAFGPNQKASMIQDPMLAHTMLFGKIVGGRLQETVSVQSLVLDTVADDLRGLRPLLPGEEGRKLERAADAFSQIRRRQSRLGGIDPQKIPPARPDFHGSMSETTRMEAHLEIAATALITGLTNTVTLGAGLGYPTWKSLGIKVDTHDIGHRLDDKAMEERATIRRFNAGLIAKLVDTLEAVPEGDGSMMDNTLIVFLSDSAESHHSTAMEWPMVLVGNLGGRLKLGGRFLNLPKYGAKGHATVAQFYTSLLHAAGAPVEHFGMKDRHLFDIGFDQREPWTHILA